MAKRLRRVVDVPGELARWDAVREADVDAYFLALPVDRTIELRFDFGEDWDGSIDLDLPRLAGARVKPVVYVSDAVVDRFDREALRHRILSAGAAYCRASLVHVVRRVARRDVRHDVALTLEESVRVFAEETAPSAVEEKVVFAVALAREADSGEKE